MLDHIHIENFRLFRELDIPKVGQVNLITGKNNAGKTTLLEALRLWGNQSNRYHFESNLIDILFSRGDYLQNSPEGFSTVFHNNNTSLPSEINQTLKIIWNNNQPNLKIKTNYGDIDITYNLAYNKYFESSVPFLPANFDLNNIRLWRNIELTEKEDKVAEVLRIIEPNIVRVSVNESEGSAKVRLKNSPKPLPIKNFGEGMNRLLSIALGLVSAENNMLLIDEVDLGLHHSAQHLLWEIVFQKAKALNVQVFATTHSSDCVEAFSEIANKPEFTGMGNYIRLQRSKKDGNIMAVDYEMEQLDRSLEFNLETR